MEMIPRPSATGLYSQLLRLRAGELQVHGLTGLQNVFKVRLENSETLQNKN